MIRGQRRSPHASVDPAAHQSRRGGRGVGKDVSVDRADVGECPPLLLRCGRCGRSLEDAAVASVHRTSDGLVGYRQCACGRISVERDGELLGGADPNHRADVSHIHGGTQKQTSSRAVSPVRHGSAHDG
jgi:hypothetical protein